MALINYLILFAFTALIIYNYPKLFLWVLGAVILIILIRLLADLYWWLKDCGRI